MVVHAVEQGDDWVVGVGPLYLVGVPLVKAELAVSGCVVWMVLTALIILILHEVQVPEEDVSDPPDDDPHHLPVQAVEGIPEEESHQAVCPSVRTKHIKNS